MFEYGRADWTHAESTYGSGQVLGLARASLRVTIAERVPIEFVIGTLGFVRGVFRSWSRAGPDAARAFEYSLAGATQSLLTLPG